MTRTDEIVPTRDAISTMPLNIRLDGRLALVVGGGAVAARKATALAAAGARLRVVAPDHGPAMSALVVEEPLTREYCSDDLDGVWFVVSATGNPEVDGAVFHDAETRRIWCNSADDPAHCSVILPAVSRRGDITVAISTGGRSPAVASWLRRRIDSLLADGVDTVLATASRVREDHRAAGLSSEQPGWADVLDGPALDLARGGRIDELERRFRSALTTTG